MSQYELPGKHLSPKLFLLWREGGRELTEYYDDPYLTFIPVVTFKIAVELFHNVQMGHQRKHCLEHCNLKYQ